MLWGAACGSQTPESEPEPAATPPPAPAPSLEQILEGLADCPAGDEPWLVAVLRTPKDTPGPTRQALEDAAEACVGAWQPGWGLGRLALTAGETEVARGRFESCHEQARRAGDAVGIARCAYRSALLRGRSGELDVAREHYEVALAAAGKAQRSDLLGMAHNSFARILRNRGEYSDALHHLEQAARHAEASGKTGWLPSIAHNRGIVAVHLGNAGAAREQLLESYRLAVESGSARADSAANYLGVVSMTLDAFDEAESWYRKVDPEGPSSYLRDFGLGRVALARGEYAEAVARFRSSAAVADEKNRLVALTARTFEADAAWRAGEIEAARKLAQAAVEQSLTAGSGENAWEARRILGKVYLAAGEPRRAIEVLEQAVAPFEGQQQTLDPLDEGLYFLRDRADPYVDLCAAIVASGAADARERVLRTMEAAQSRALRAVSRDRAPLRSPGLVELQQGLAPGDLLLDYLIGEDRGVLLAVRAGGAQVALLPGAPPIRERVRGLREALSGETPFSQQDSGGPWLRSKLLGPVEPWLADAERLLVVPDREIARIPFAALPAARSGEGFLGNRLEVAFTPLPSRFPRAASTPGRVLLAGDPVFPAGSFATLPWSAFELTRIAEIWRDRARTISGAGLTAERLGQEDLAAFDVLHFSTHALASSRDPRAGGIVLSSGERLDGEQVLSLPLRDSLVVLSACRTGEGEAVPGQGVISLGWAFLVAGARGVVVSQWTADDASTARLMVAFHRELAKGSEPLEALAEARRSVAERYPHPRHWAAFDLFLRP